MYFLGVEVGKKRTGLPLGPSSPGGPLGPGGPAVPAGPDSPFSPRSPLGPWNNTQDVNYSNAAMLVENKKKLLFLIHVNM